MKLLGVFRFELGYQLRRPWPWLMFAVMLVVSFLMTRDAALQDALYDEFFVNSPFQIVVSTVVGVLLWLLVAPVIAGEAAARDVATGMYPLMYTAPLSKAQYLGGRFVAALVLNAVLLLAVQVGSFRTEGASARQLADSSWEVTLDVTAHKAVADSTGFETEAPLNEWIELGVYAPSEVGELGSPLYLQKHLIRTGRQRFVLSVPRRPLLAGIDPRHLLDWVEGVDDDDNIQRVEVEIREATAQKR